MSTTTTTLGNADAVLTGSATVILTGSAMTQLMILKATVFNSDTGAHTVKVYRVPNAGSAGAANQLFGTDISVGPQQTVTLPLSGQTLLNNQTLQALADTTSVVNLSIGYVTSP